MSADKIKSNTKLSIVVARYYISHARLEKLVSKFIKKLSNRNTMEINYIKFIDLKSETLYNKNKLLFKWMDKEPSFIDFSAYEEIQNDGNQDLFLYINDTIFIKHPWTIIAQQLKSLIPTLSSINHPAAIGIVFPYSEALINDKINPTLDHMTTFCFVLNKSANKILDEKLNSLPRSESMVTDWINQKISSNLFIEYLMKIHLFGPDSPWKWKGVDKNLSKKTMNRKAISVILEYELNASILNSNGLIIPILRDYKYLIFQKIQTVIGRIIYRGYF